MLSTILKQGAKEFEEVIGGRVVMQSTREAEAEEALLQHEAKLKHESKMERIAEESSYIIPEHISFKYSAYLNLLRHNLTELGHKLLNLLESVHVKVGEYIIYALREIALAIHGGVRTLNDALHWLGLNVKNMYYAVKDALGITDEKMIQLSNLVMNLDHTPSEFPKLEGAELTDAGPITKFYT